MKKIKEFIYLYVLVCCYFAEITSKFLHIARENVADWADVDDKDYL